MTKRILPTPEELRQLLRYEPETGKLFWKMRNPDDFSSRRIGNTWNSRYGGKEALACIDRAGYKHGCVLGKNQKSHRVAWAIFYGEWPTGFLDHANCDKTDNRISNLREASRPENGWNVGRASTNTSGYKGVTFFAPTGKWRARITVGGKVEHLGHYKSREDAHAAYCAAAKKYHGEFARTE